VDSKSGQGSDFYPAVIGEKAKQSTDNRYLVFFDDGFASYLDHADLRVVVKFSTDVWLDVDRETREFMKEYIQSFPMRQMIRLEGRKEGYESDVEDIEAEEKEEKKDAELKSEEGKMEVDDIKSEKVEEPLAESKPGEVAEVKPEEDSISKGEEVKPKEEEKKPEVKHKSVRKYFGPLEDIYIMDAMTEGNIGRYLNHSCDPNVFVQNVFIESHDLRFPTIAFFTFKFVPAGSELCWNYNYEVGTVENKQIICNCGAKNCKGRLL